MHKPRRSVMKCWRGWWVLLAFIPSVGLAQSKPANEPGKEEKIAFCQVDLVKKNECRLEFCVAKAGAPGAKSIIAENMEGKLARVLQCMSEVQAETGTDDAHRKAQCTDWESKGLLPYPTRDIVEEFKRCHALTHCYERSTCMGVAYNKLQGVGSTSAPPAKGAAPATPKPGK